MRSLERVLLAVAALAAPAIAFAPVHPVLVARAPCAPLMAKPQADFEYQELKVQLDGMRQSGVASRDLEPAKRIELANYARQILRQRNSPVPLHEVGQSLVGSKWRMALATDESSEALPRDATVVLDFVDDARLDYQLQFSEKTFGLNRITAQSSWKCNTGPIDPGAVSFTYDNITTDMFGFSNLGVGTFGLLQGRVTTIYTAYFDGQLWIERGLTGQGNDYVNVYIRED